MKSKKRDCILLKNAMTKQRKIQFSKIKIHRIDIFYIDYVS